MVYPITYRRPARVSRESSIHSKESERAESVSSRSSCAYGIPEALSFDRIISGGTCPPCTTREFLDFLVYVENAAENLQFYLWYRDYVTRFEQLPESEKSLSPPWIAQPSKPKEVPKTTNPRPEMTTDEKREANEEVSAALKGTFFDPPTPMTVCEIKDNPFHSPPATPSGDRPSMDHSTVGWSEEMSMLNGNSPTTHTDATADAFKSAKALQPFTVQPYREEISRVIAVYIAKDGQRRLNLSDRESSQLLRILSTTTHPSAFRDVLRTIERTLRHQAHPNFIRYAICNGNRPRVVFARGLGLTGITAGFVCAIILTLSSAPRGWRALSAIGFFIGIATLVAAWKGMCVVLHGMHHRHLRPWELFASEEDASSQLYNLSAETLQSSNSYETEPWLAKYEKRNVVRKVFDREVWIQEPALRQIQDTIFLQAILVGLVLTAVAMAVFIPLPKGNFY